MTEVQLLIGDRDAARSARNVVRQNRSRAKLLRAQQRQALTMRLPRPKPRPKPSRLGLRSAPTNGARSFTRRRLLEARTPEFISVMMDEIGLRRMAGFNVYLAAQMLRELRQ